jgi:hypothetical protein
MKFESHDMIKLFSHPLTLNPFPLHLTLQKHEKNKKLRLTILNLTIKQSKFADYYGLQGNYIEKHK